jgi:low affinity Fe/Cu permease
MDDGGVERAHSPFSRFARWAARKTGHGGAFLLAILVVLVWAVTGPLFGFSDTWQLVINTGTTIVTFLMVFLIQNSQTRDSEAIHIKLDELIEAMPGARRELLDLEELPEEQLHRLQSEYEELAARARRQRRRRKGSKGKEELTPMEHRRRGGHHGGPG